MSEDNKNIGMNMTNKNLEFEEESDSTEKSVPMGDIYKYTNKGKLHEFNLGLLTPQERKKFDKMSNKEKQRFIASVELQQMPSMFDEISLKSVVYPDPDSNIADVQAAAAKYTALQRLVDEDPVFKEMELSYLKYPEVQKYITDHCPQVNKYDVELLLKLKPDMTVNQFMNYFKNIMNNKNLVEINKIQKQLKNPYSDDLLKKILSVGDSISNGVLKLIVDNNFATLKDIYDDLKRFLDTEIKRSSSYDKETRTTEYSVYGPKLDAGTAEIVGVPTSEKQDFKPAELEKVKLAYKTIGNVISSVNNMVKPLKTSLNLIGLKIEDYDSMKEVLFDRQMYEELKGYINEMAWDIILDDYAVSQDKKNPRWKTIEKNRLNDIDKDELNEEMKEDREEVQRKKKELEDKYNAKIKPRDEQNIEVNPLTDEYSDMPEPELISAITPQSVRNINENILTENNQEPSIMPEIIPFVSKKDEVNSLKVKLNDLISNRIKELENEYSNLEDYSRVYGEIPDDKKGLGIIRRDGRQTTTYEHSAAEYVRIYNLLKKGIRIRLFKDTNTNKKHKQYTSLGKEFATDEMIELAKKIDGLGGSIFSRIKNTFRAPDEIKETKMKLSELSEKTVENNKSLRELEKTIEELTNRVNELSKQVGKSYVDRKMSKPSFLNDITKPQNLKPVEKPKEQFIPQENPDSMEEQIRRKLEERRRDLEPDYSEESEEEWGEGLAGKIKIESSDTKKPIPMSDFFKKYL